MITLARPEHLPGLRDIWMRSFGDGEAYTAYLFENLLKLENLVVCLEQEAPAAMLCLQPMELDGPEGRCAGAYIFGVATAPEFRGKGLSTALLEGTHRLLKKRGCAASVLVPASESLFGFYGRRGYEDAFCLKKARFAGAALAPPDAACVLVPAPFELLEEQRALWFGENRPFVRWPREYLGFIGGECRLLGGEVLKVAGVGKNGYAVCYPTEDSVIVKELAVEPRGLPGALYAIHRRYAKGEYLVYLPADYPVEGAVLPFGMVRWYDKRKRGALAGGLEPYLAHVLD